ncbi:MAG: hypothetical protein GXP44_02305 [bacterium]|nr:hypothetical protein [bacterium]
MKIYYKRPEIVRKYVSSDVALVKKSARVLVLIKYNGEIAVFNQEKWKLNVVAVVGPGTINGSEMFFQEAVLLEIGIGPTRPYHDSRVAGWLRKRRKWFFVSQEQYRLLRPIILKIIKDIATEKISDWKNLTWTIPETKNHYSRKRKKFFQDSIRWRKYPTGTRFSVSKKDDLFLADIYAFDAENNPLVRKQLEGLAKFIDLCLGGYCKERYTPRQMNRILSSSHGRAAAVATVLEQRRLFSHHYHWILNSGLVRKKELFLQIAEHLGLATEERIHKAGYLMGLPVTGNGGLYGLQIRTIRPNFKRRDFVVFEVSIPQLIKEREDAENLPF